MYVLSTIQALKIAREDNKTQLWRLQLTSSQTQTDNMDGCRT